MRTLSLVAGAALAIVLCAPLSAQQGSVVSARELDAALETHAQGVDADRAAVARVLAHPQVEAAAKAHGIGDRLEEARALSGSLSGDRLTQASSYARTLEVQLAGGQTITFSTITIILILLIVIIVILVAD